MKKRSGLTQSVTTFKVAPASAMTGPAEGIETILERWLEVRFKPLFSLGDAFYSLIVRLTNPIHIDVLQNLI